MPIYHHQIHTLKAGASVPRLYEAIQHEYLPLIEELDVRIVGYWETTDIQGTSNETIAVWEFDDYRHLERFVRAEYGATGGEPRLRQWHERQHEWITQTQGMICEPCESSPTVADLRNQKIKAAMCTHEVVTCAPHRHAEYGQRLHEMWHNRFSLNDENPKERGLVGLYYAKWTNTVAINIWGTGGSWENMRIWDPEWEKDPSFDLWNTLGREIRSDFYDRFIVPAPFSLVQ